MLGIYGEVDGWSEIVLKFRKLADDGMVPPICAEPGHKDGWGMAGANRDRTSMFQIERQMGSAGSSPLYESAIQTVEAQPHIFICHIRKASPGIPVTIGNVHPFINQEWAFIHNGTIYDHHQIEENPDFQMTSDGSDSEHFFSYLLGKLQAAGNGSGRLNALGEAMTNLNVTYTSLNCILCNGSELFAIRDYMKFGEYLSLFYYPLPRGVIICSEPLELPELAVDRWLMIPDKTILRISGSPPSIETARYIASSSLE